MPKRNFRPDQIDDIRCMYRKHVHYQGIADVYKVANIAAHFGVRPNAIYDIINGVTYANVPDKYCIDAE
jgi:hypothetical protein